MLYADTGALVSLYVADTFSTTATRLLRDHAQPALTPLHRAEFANALALGIFRRAWTREDAAAVAAQFGAEQGQGHFDLRIWPEAAWHLAAQLSEVYSPRLGVRTLDLLHVAAAMALGSDRFVSFDRRQRRLAAAVGLAVSP